MPKGDLVKQAELSDELHNCPEISSIISYVDTVGVEIPEEYLDSDTLSQLVSDNYSRMVLSVDVDYEGEETFNLVEKIRNIADRYYPDSFYLAGEGVSTYDLMKTVTADMIKVNLIAIAAVFIVLLLTMRSISLPIILVLSIETAIWLNLSVPHFSNSTIFYIAYLIISSIQLGATVDYAILLTERYLLGYISSNQLLAQLGIFLGRGAVCSLLIVFFVLPGLLYLFDRVIIRKTKKI